MINFKDTEVVQEEVEEEYDYMNEEPLEDDSDETFEYDEGRYERECE